jgi:hypothetical protein
MTCPSPATTVDLVRVSEMIDGARALIFDADGTLAETEALLSAATGKDWAGRFEACCRRSGCSGKNLRLMSLRAMHSPPLVAESPVM